jgi:hypothetical protein
MALSVVVPSHDPKATGTGGSQVTTGVALLTVSVTDAVAEL